VIRNQELPDMVVPSQVTRQLPPDTRFTVVTLTSAGRTALRVDDVLALLRKATPSQAVYFVYTGATFSNAVAE
jgi:hypothetical protein